MIKFALTSLGYFAWHVLAAVGRLLWALIWPGLRFLSGVFLIAAIIALTMDVTRWQVAPSGPLFQSLAEEIRASAPATLDALGKAVGDMLHPLVWDPLFTSFLSLPAWMVLAGFSFALAYATRERRKIDIFIN
ncbi:MAG: hypothetical protein KDK91_21365 [Gammaproteobacteria bacterium]|nr:hypothetical protein [Gammaproteobacteria bacterium]